MNKIKYIICKKVTNAYKTHWEIKNSTRGDYTSGIGTAVFSETMKSCPTSINIITNLRMYKYSIQSKRCFRQLEHDLAFHLPISIYKHTEIYITF